MGVVARGGLIGYSPMGANPRIEDSVGGFKVWTVESSILSVSFDSIILFRYSVVVEDSCVLSKEVLEVKWADGDLLAFVKTENKKGA